jgi:amino acid adenylation domain-containing protein
VITDNENVALVKHLVAHKSLRNSVQFVDIHEQATEIKQCEQEIKRNLPHYTENEETPAAILYTSGSTGQPKGVCLTHRGLSRMVMNTNYMQLNDSDRVAHVSNICFDAASFEIWAALLNGLPLIILEKDIMLDLHKFEQALKKEKVSILLITTALFNLVAKEQASAFSDIRYLFFGGEACNAGMVKKVLDEAQPKHLMHMYGPSENATYATWYEVKAVSEDAKSIPIGKAVSNSQVYIMNQQGELLPPGVAGEIVCAGDGLALGYLNKPEQTQKAFVMRKLPNREDQRMYLTGDLGVCLPDGNIEILGRIDNQVKIRGHRIEPEEIIARINALPEIKKAYVLVKQDKEDKKYLVAYFVPEKEWQSKLNDKAARTRELKMLLKGVMPDYMVPGFYVEIDDLPLTPNGKIDTKALPDANLLQSASAYQAPESELEEQLVAIWEEVLDQERVGVLDDFFELGGHSLLATQIHSRIRQQLNIDIPLRTLFELPTIKEFGEFWEAVSSTQNMQHDDNSDNEDFEEGEL